MLVAIGDHRAYGQSIENFAKQLERDSRKRFALIVERFGKAIEFFGKDSAAVETKKLYAGLCQTILQYARGFREFH